MLALLLLTTPPDLLTGDAARTPDGVALVSRGAGAAVSRDVPVDAKTSRWHRLSVRGLPQPNFAVGDTGLTLRADFFAGDRPLDGVTKPLAPLVERARRDLAANGNARRGGAAAWQTYQLDIRLPFPGIDRVRVGVVLSDGRATADADAAFVVGELRLDPLAIPEPLPGVRPPEVDVKELVPLGGRWFYRPEPGRAIDPDGLVVTAANAGRLFYRDAALTNPFAENMTATLRKGFKDRAGNVVAEDRPVPDSVTLTFLKRTTLVVRVKNLPNHPTGTFPERRGNPHFIREQDDTYRLPLDPKPDPAAVAMDAGNRNRALPMGPVGVAVNGVVFFNPFDRGLEDAHDLMDTCCGHPAPDDRYHYHKYPVCVRSPFADDGEGHSPVVGWAFDGLPVYGPYEGRGVMAMHATANPLDAFNAHHDPDRGWHYHVTPGKFPYIIGGYKGTPDPAIRKRSGDRDRGERPV